MKKEKRGKKDQKKERKTSKTKITTKFKTKPNQIGKEQPMRQTKKDKYSKISPDIHNFVVMSKTDLRNALSTPAKFSVGFVLGLELILSSGCGGWGWPSVGGVLQSSLI